MSVKYASECSCQNVYRYTYCRLVNNVAGAVSTFVCLLFSKVKKILFQLSMTAFNCSHNVCNPVQVETDDCEAYLKG